MRFVAAALHGPWTPNLWAGMHTDLYVPPAFRREYAKEENPDWISQIGYPREELLALHAGISHVYQKEKKYHSLAERLENAGKSDRFGTEKLAIKAAFDRVSAQAKGRSARIAQVQREAGLATLETCFLLQNLC